jgi:hypothetical protein
MPEKLYELLSAWNPRAAQHMRSNWRWRNAVTLSWEARRSMSTEEQMNHARALIQLDENLGEDWRSCWC